MRDTDCGQILSSITLKVEFGAEIVSPRASCERSSECRSRDRGNSMRNVRRKIPLTKSPRFHSMRRRCAEEWRCVTYSNRRDYCSNCNSWFYRHRTISIRCYSTSIDRRQAMSRRRNWSTASSKNDSRRNDDDDCRCFTFGLSYIRVGSRVLAVPLWR